jgi:hypothetical protein
VSYRNYSSRLRCLWCNAEIVALPERGALGGRWVHKHRSRELCPDNVTIAEPLGGHPDDMPQEARR